MPSEIKLLDALSAATVCNLSSEELHPKFASKTIRGSFLTNLIKGKLGENLVPSKGILIVGAHVIGDVDLCGCNISHPISLRECKILGVLDFSNSSINELVLTGSSVERLCLSEMTCKGSVILSYGFRTLHSVVARGAKIGGQLGCSGGEFCGYPLAISLEAAVVEESFFWRHVKGLWGTVDLTNAHVGCLIDDPDSWPDKGNLRLAGFSYGSIESNTSTDYFDRLDWLERQYEPHLTDDFRPQPFEQLAKVLGESGREMEAKKVAINKLHFQRNSNFTRRNRKVVELMHKLRTNRSLFSYVNLSISLEQERKLSFDNVILFMMAGWHWLVSLLFWAFAGYGYRPTRCIGWSLLMIVLGGLIFAEHQKDGNIYHISSSPNNISQGFVRDSPEFHPLAYAADVFIPFVDLGQAPTWVIRAEPEQKGQLILLFYWGYIFLGWIFAAIFGASVTGLVRK